MENTQLQHHGTKGMKWGVRRYQNKDGSLTTNGKKRYGVIGSIKEHHAQKKKQKQRTEALEKARAAKYAKKQHEEEKQKVLKSGSATEVLKYKGELTKQEMDAVWSRIQWEQNMDGAAVKEASEKGKKFFDRIERTTGYAVTAAKAWNMIANVHNGLNTNRLLPKFDTDIVKGNRNERKAEKKERQKVAEARKKREEQEAQKEKVHNERAAKKKAKKDEPLGGTVEGEGTSRSRFNEKNFSSKKPDSYYDPIDTSFINDTPMSSVRNSRQAQIGQSYIDNLFLLEDKSAR